MSEEATFIIETSVFPITAGAVSFTRMNYRGENGRSISRNTLILKLPGEFRYVFEFRNDTWSVEALFTLIESADIVLRLLCMKQIGA